MRTPLREGNGGLPVNQWKPGILAGGIEAFEMLARASVALSARSEAAFSDLVDPVHQRGRVFGWEVQATTRGS
jgi:hypothetical protein